MLLSAPQPTPWQRVVWGRGAYRPTRRRERRAPLPTSCQGTEETPLPKSRQTKCALCEERSPYKLATIYWAWTWPSGDRRCYKQWFDATCFHTVIEKLNRSDNTDQCFFCGELAATVDDLNLYATYYIPGRERADGFATMHQNCLMNGEHQLTQNGVRMPDRGRDFVQQVLPITGNPWDSWDQMGLRPL